MKTIYSPEKSYVGSKEFKIARFEAIVPLTHLDDVVERNFMVFHHSQSQALTLRDPSKVNFNRAAADSATCRKLLNRSRSSKLSRRRRKLLNFVIATSATAVCLQVGVALHMWRNEYFHFAIVRQ